MAYSTDHRITKVLHSYRNKAMFMSVLTPLFGTEWCHGNSKREIDASIAASLIRLRKVWAVRLADLHRYNWPAVADVRKFSYMLNCPFFGVQSKGKTRSCRRSMVCPFCYARDYVRKTFLLFEKVLYADMHPRTKPVTAGLSLVEFRTKTVITGDDMYEIVRGGIRDEQLRRREYTLCKADCGVMQYQAAPVENGIRFSRCGLYLTKHVFDINILRVQDIDYCAVTVLDAVTAVKQLLAEACARVLAYPQEMLYTTPASKVVDLTHELRRHRMFSQYGFLQTQKEDIDDAKR